MIRADFTPTLEWLEKIKRGVGDARPLWVAMQPKVIEWIKQEFTDSNPNKWKKLSPKYLEWKLKNNFPATIGILTGDMLKAASDNAIVEMTERHMSVEVNQAEAPHSVFFHFGTKKMPARGIYKRTRLVIDSWLRDDIRDMEGGSRSAFTFQWLRKFYEQ